MKRPYDLGLTDFQFEPYLPGAQTTYVISLLLTSNKLLSQHSYSVRGGSALTTPQDNVSEGLMTCMLLIVH